MKEISSGVCAPKGYKAAGVHCGIRKNQSKKDLALIVSETRAAAAAVYTCNLVKSAPIKVTKANLSDGYAQAVICNSGIANTCRAEGVEMAQRMCELVEQAAGVPAGDVIVGSTGVIGAPLPIECIEAGMPALVSALGDHSADAEAAIMTTDTVPKEFAVEFEADGMVCRMGGIAKGSGMIHPNMATMLVFITTDCAITPELLQKSLSSNVKTTFNMVSVDGDTSTNDMVSVMANGMAGNPPITGPGADYDAFDTALNAVMTALCKMIAADGEGASKFLECVVSGADTYEAAALSAKSVICSSLFKAAMFGADANWGRALCAIGYSGADVDVEQVRMSFKSAAGEILVCDHGIGVDFDEEKAKKILTEKEIQILISVGPGSHTATAWGCDLTYDYVKINGDYRS
ncbi:MAG: bifunctional glutamate N-acetyltransferase/amino-acid acetyltransferase ArgJ [Oscillospiraceae bacterium]|jgi:glutamate N-acetyltransferase/amino-acid N-acetyltransferase|nr:bifunctional glutamate N-acetyltransferase/amino-acid acetyltransferase ArgJ [Oscillospiraceae bacterium]